MYYFVFKLIPLRSERQTSLGIRNPAVDNAIEAMEREKVVTSSTLTEL
jgi:hypothetical protein